MGRFKNLESALRYLRAPGGASDPNTPPPSPPAGSQLAEYVEFRTKKKIVSYTRDASSHPGNLDDVIILPFAEDEIDNLVLVNFSSRSKLKMSDAGMSTALLNHKSTGAAQRMHGFEPARAIVTIGSTGQGVTTTSKITGRPYKKKSNNSYTFPMGKAGISDTYKKLKGDILTAVSAKGGTYSVSFRPEVFR